MTFDLTLTHEKNYHMHMHPDDENVIDLREPFPTLEEPGEFVVFLIPNPGAEQARRERELREAPEKERRRVAALYDAILDGLAELD